MKSRREFQTVVPATEKATSVEGNLWYVINDK